MHAHALDDLFGAKTGTGVVVGLPAGNDVDDTLPARQVPGEIAENLTGGGVVGIEKSIDEEDLAHRVRRNCNLRTLYEPQPAAKRCQAYWLARLIINRLPH